MSDSEIPPIPDEARDLETVPEGLIVPSEPPDGAIDGAPEWAKAFFEELHESRKDMRRVLRNQELSRREFDRFRAETRGRLGSHDLELELLRMADDSHQQTQVKHAQDLRELKGGLKLLERRIDEHIESHKDDDDQ